MRYHAEGILEFVSQGRGVGGRQGPSGFVQRLGGLVKLLGVGAGSIGDAGDKARKFGEFVLSRLSQKRGLLRSLSCGIRSRGRLAPRRWVLYRRTVVGDSGPTPPARKEAQPQRLSVRECRFIPLFRRGGVPDRRIVVTPSVVRPFWLRALAPIVITLMYPLWLHAGSARPLSSDEQAIARLLAIAGEGFRVRETDHFRIAYDTSYEALRPLVGRLEGTFDSVWRFCNANALASNGLSSRLDVLLFDRFEDFTRYGAGVGVSAGSIAGFYHPRTNIATFCNTQNSPGLAQLTLQFGQVQAQLKRATSKRGGTPAARRRRSDLQQMLSVLQTRREVLVKRFNRFVIQHEAAHQLLFNLGLHVRGADNPSWLVEGLACQFEVPQANQAGLLKRINHLRLADFRDALGVGLDVKHVEEEACRRLLADGRIVPLADLIASPDPFERRGDGIAYRYA